MKKKIHIIEKNAQILESDESAMSQRRGYDEYAASLRRACDESAASTR